MRHKCSASCTAGWGKTNKSHCSLCGWNFTTPSNFDKHQARGDLIVCRDPAEVGLVLNARGVWASPEETDWDERFKR